MMDTVEIKTKLNEENSQRMSSSYIDKKTVNSSTSKSDVDSKRPFTIPKHELEVLLERDNRVNATLREFSLEDHQEIKWHHRAILLDWTLEVCSELGLKRQTW